MAFHDLLVTEIFHSLQGETSLVGTRFGFIRLSGCNLRCTYCDTSYAFKGGKILSIAKILEEIEPFGVKHVLITGGEPLLQRNTPALVEALKQKKYTVSIETHGEVSIASVAQNARIVMDIKTPGSEMCRMGFVNNLHLLKPNDEIKFVITSERDYNWAKDLILRVGLPPLEILFSPAAPAQNSPGSFSGVDPAWLAEKIIEDRLPVRLQIQMHKILWGNRKGV